MEKHTEPRYEFRMFGIDLENYEQTLKTIATFEKVRSMQSVYLLAAGNPDHNVKIREGVMDIKILQNTFKGLELWSPLVIGAFPLKPDIIKSVVFPSLGVSFPEFGRQQYNLNEFIKELITVDPDLSVAWVYKKREGFLVNECIAEIAEIIVNGAFIKTLCVESENLDKVLETKAMLGITENIENVNYPLALKRIMGLVELPENWKKRV